MTTPGLEAGLFAPVPVVNVNGTDVASGAGGSSSLMVVDGVRVTWGRDDVLEQPTPATGRLVLFDRTRTWATDTDRRGQAVTIRWQGTLAGVTYSAVFFRGRIGSPVKVSLRTVLDPVTGEELRGSLVELPLQSILVDLGNYVPRGAYPVETMGARTDRVVAAAQAAGLLAGGGNVRTFWRDPNVEPVAAKDQPSLLTHLTDLFDSAGADNFTYKPDSDELRFTPRRNYRFSRSLARLTRTSDPTFARANKGAYIRTVAQDFTELSGQTEAGPGLYLDSAALEYEPASGVTTPARITRVAITHPTDTDSYNDRTVEIPVRHEPWSSTGLMPVDEKVNGVRTARADSIVAWNIWAEVSLSDTEELVRREGSRWVLQPLRYSSAKVGGFESLLQAQVLLAGYERNSLLFLQRSWLPQLGMRPIFGVMGGSIEYQDKSWELELELAPVTTILPQHSLTWEDLYSSDPTLELQWWDGVHPLGMHPSVTYEDLRFVGYPLSGAAPLESQRDEYQT